MRPDIVPGSKFPDYEPTQPQKQNAKAQRTPGRRPADSYPRTRPLLPQGASAASPACRVFIPASPWRTPTRHHLHRRPPHFAGVSRIPRRPVDIFYPTQSAKFKRPRHRGVHRPRTQSHDSAHDCCQAGSRGLSHLQRLLVSGAALPSPTSGTTCAR